MSKDTKLLPSERLQKIRQLLVQHGVVRITELAQLLEVSEMTVRRDLSELERSGEIEKTFGAAILAEKAGHENSHQVRLKQNPQQKKAIAALAAGFVQEGDTLALDASTTCLALAEQLALGHGYDPCSLTVITNSLDIANTLRYSGATVILLGGVLRESIGSCVGPFGLHALSTLRFDIAFVSAKGLLIPDGLLESDLSEAEMKRNILGHAAKRIALMDSSKFGKRATSLIVPLGELERLITDDHIAPEALSALHSLDLQTHIAPVAPFKP